MPTDPADSPTQAMTAAELYEALGDHLAQQQPPYDVEGGLRDLNTWIDAQSDTNVHRGSQL